MDVFQSYKDAVNSLFLPRLADGNFAKCQQYDVDVNSVIEHLIGQNKYVNSTIINELVHRGHWPSVQCRYGWDYDTTEFSETAATKVTPVRIAFI